VSIFVRLSAVLALLTGFDRVTLDVLPQRRTSFTLSEDDRVTRSTKTATQTFQSSAAVNDSGDVTVRIGELRVSYAGKPVQRPYQLTVHTGTEPKQVVADGKVVPAGRTPDSAATRRSALGSGAPALRRGARSVCLDFGRYGGQGSMRVNTDGARDGKVGIVQPCVLVAVE
jgi:hypothetical protein